MISRVIALAGILLLASGCATLGKIIPVLGPDYERLERDKESYTPAKICTSPKLDIVINVRKPLENPEEDIWTKDMQLVMTLRRGDESVVTITRYDETQYNQATGRPVPRTFFDFEDMEIVDINFNWAEGQTSTLKDLFKFLRSLKDIITSKIFYWYEVRALRYELYSAYNDVINACLYGYH